MFSILKQFKGHKVELSVEPDFCFIFQKFNLTFDDENLVLYDQLEDESRVLIPLDEVLEISNLTDDIYRDVIDIKTSTYSLSICSMEERPISPTCNKCGKDLSKEYIWELNQRGEYGSKYDGELKKIKLCDDCLDSLVS